MEELCPWPPSKVGFCNSLIKSARIIDFGYYDDYLFICFACRKLFRCQGSQVRIQRRPHKLVIKKPKVNFHPRVLNCSSKRCEPELDSRWWCSCTKWCWTTCWTSPEKCFELNLKWTSQTHVRKLVKYDEVPFNTQPFFGRQNSKEGDWWCMKYEKIALTKRTASVKPSSKKKFGC